MDDAFRHGVIEPAHDRGHQLDHLITLALAQQDADPFLERLDLGTDRLVALGPAGVLPKLSDSGEFDRHVESFDWLVLFGWVTRPSDKAATVARAKQGVNVAEAAG